MSTTNKRWKASHRLRKKSNVRDQTNDPLFKYHKSKTPDDPSEKYYKSKTPDDPSEKYYKSKQVDDHSECFRNRRRQK